MSQIEQSTDKLLVLGSGLELGASHPEGLRLAIASEQRADRAGQYYREHAAAFAGNSAMIICAGGASAIYDGLHDVPDEWAEGSLVADRLLNKWGVPSRLIETETRSDTSTLNIVNSIEAGYLSLNEFDESHQLGVVTHKNHYTRVKKDLHDVGFKPTISFGIHPPEADSAVKELAARVIRTAFFLGVKRGNLDDIRARSERVTKVFGR